MHTHETDGTIHVEGAAERTTIGQFMALWDVTFGRDRLGPYRSNGSERVRMWVKMPGGKLFKESRPNGAAKLTDGGLIPDHRHQLPDLPPFPAACPHFEVNRDIDHDKRHPIIRSD